MFGYKSKERKRLEQALPAAQHLATTAEEGLNQLIQQHTQASEEWGSRRRVVWIDAIKGFEASYRLMEDDIATLTREMAELDELERAAKDNPLACAQYQSRKNVIDLNIAYTKMLLFGCRDDLKATREIVAMLDMKYGKR